MTDIFRWKLLVYILNLDIAIWSFEALPKEVSGEKNISLNERDDTNWIFIADMKQSNIITGLDGPWEFQKFEAPRF